MKNNLTPKQIEIITRMRKGDELIINRLPRRTNRYYLGNDTRKLLRRNVVDLYDMGILKAYSPMKVILTDIGNNIEL